MKFEPSLSSFKRMLKQTVGIQVPTAAAAVTLCLVIVYYFRTAKRSPLEARTKQRKRKTSPLPAGLINIGNSCYLSSVVQLLAAADSSLRKHFSGCGEIGKELADLIELINIEEEAGIKRRPIRPVKFVSSFSKYSGFSSEQQDAHEFLLALLNLNHYSEGSLLKRTDSLSLSRVVIEDDERVFKTKDPFTGLLMSEFVCLPCAIGKVHHISSVKIEPFRCVTLALGACSVEMGVREYLCDPERVDDYVNYCGDGRCRCGGLGAIRRKNCLKFPELLFLHLSVLSESFMKRDESIRADFELSGPGYRYELVGMIVHFGSTGHSGHFVCYRRHCGGWIECNDSSVKRTSRETVQCQRPYILLYKLKL